MIFKRIFYKEFLITVTKLGLGLVSKRYYTAETTGSLLVAIITTMQQHPIEVQPFLGKGCYIHINRQIVANMAVEQQCSHLLFVDSDMVFHHDAILKLMSHDKDIVGARYNKCILPIESTVKQDIKELSEVPFVPTGFLLINTEIFKKIGKPYFSFDDGAESEDKYFCDKAIANGFKVWCDPTIVIGHLGDVMY